MYFVYILKSKLSGKYYIGSTNNLSDRLKRHNNLESNYTKSQVPWQVIYKEKYYNLKEAYRRELQIKSYKGGNAFKKLISGEVA